MKRVGFALSVAGVVLVSCAPAQEVVSPTSMTEAGTSTSSTTSPTSSTVPDDTVGAESVLVANDQGAFEWASDGPTQLVEGPVLVMISDRQGGFLYQRAWSPGEIHWIPAGDTEPQVLVTPNDDHTIVLHDVALGEDGATIWYTRSRGSTIEDAVDVLYTMSLTTGEEIELGVVGGWEAGARFSVSPDLVVGEWWAEANHGFSTYDGSFEPVATDWNPYGPDGETDCGPCAQHLDVSTDGSRVAWIEGREAGGFFVQTLVVIEVTTGDSIAEIALPDDRVGIISSLHLGPDAVLISHTGRTSAPWLPVIRVDLTSGSITEPDIDGNARFAEG